MPLPVKKLPSAIIRERNIGPTLLGDYVADLDLQGGCRQALATLAPGLGEHPPESRPVVRQEHAQRARPRGRGGGSPGVLCRYSHRSRMMHAGQSGFLALHT